MSGDASGIRQVVTVSRRGCCRGGGTRLGIEVNNFSRGSARAVRDYNLPDIVGGAERWQRVGVCDVCSIVCGNRGSTGYILLHKLHNKHLDKRGKRWDTDASSDHLSDSATHSTNYVNSKIGV